MTQEQALPLIYKEMRTLVALITEEMAVLDKKSCHTNARKNSQRNRYTNNRKRGKR